MSDQGDRRRAELDELVAAMGERRLDEAGFDRLNELILSGAEWAHHCVEQLDLQAGMLRFAYDTDAGAIVDRVLDRQGRAARRGRKVRAAVATTGLTAAAAVVFLIALLIGPRASAPVVGRLVAVAGGTAWKSPARENGTPIRRGETVTLASGFVTVELPDGVVADLVGPAKVRFDAGDRLWLASGQLAARVGPAGRGFTVRTEDADVVDLGTAFQVHKDFTLGTQVRVTEGQVETRLKDASGDVVKFLDLVAGDTARLDHAAGVAELRGGLFDFAATFDPLERAKGGVLRFAGAAEPLASPLVGLDTRAGATNTLGRVYVVPERSGVVLGEDLSFTTPAGPVVLPAGTTLDSYLFHFDMGGVDVVTALGRGSVTFGTPVVAVIDTAADLAMSDESFANPGARFDPGPDRGFEPGEDVAAVSPDGRTVTFDFDVSPPGSLDQFRVLVRGTVP